MSTAPAPPDLNALPLPALFAELARGGAIRRLLELARDEDLGAAGDVTTAAWSPPHHRIRANIVARREGVIAGLAAAPILLSLFAPHTTLDAHCADGERATPRQSLATLDGPASEVLALERTHLNLLGRLSGIATLTAQYVRAIDRDHHARLFDTRKTTPGLRALEKYAVRCGGGFCHRLGLHDALLIKDNHIAGVSVAELPEFVERAAAAARAAGPLLFVEVEADTLEQVSALLTLPAGVIDIILLDNMTPDQLREAAARRDRANPAIELEASGGVSLGAIAAIAATGIDRVSVGALTHQAVSRDFALDAEA